MYGYLYWENWGLEQLPNDMGFIPNLNINVENLPFFNISRTLHARVETSLRAHVKGLLGLLFQKYIYLLIKSYIFHFNISQVNLTSDWTPNQP